MRQSQSIEPGRFFANAICRDHVVMSKFFVCLRGHGLLNSRVQSFVYSSPGLENFFLLVSLCSLSLNLILFVIIHDTN